MFTKQLSQCRQIRAGDGCYLKELLHPNRDPVDIGFSLASAWIVPGQSTYPHRLQAAEVYYFTAGEGLMTVNGREQSVEAGACVYVPPGAVQSVTNTSQTGNLEFFCVVDPPWQKADEEVL